MKKTLQKIKEGALIGLGFIAIVGFTGLSYAAITWVTQSDVNPGDTLSASNWNDMVNNQNYLKQEVETSVVSKLGDAMAGELNMGTNKITALGTPTATTDATTKAYVDSVSASGEGQYQLSCSSYGNGTNNDMMRCIRINTTDGTSSCKYFYRSNSSGWVNWTDCSNPW